ncbi:hypothetical protein PENSPDRAFT_651760 [Peniophora sp. CONT]|nr:hypothetical protein PENSPDRAFT_651760 [Peniophora sp. CONT]
MSNTNEPVPNERDMPAIHKISDDVLYLILLHLCAIDPTGQDGDNKLGWIAATHVCSRWRRVAIHECALLWAQSICALPKAIPTILERARDAHLTLELTEPEYASESPTPVESNALKTEIMDIITQHSHQLRRVAFTFPDFQYRMEPLGPNAVIFGEAIPDDEEIAGDPEPGSALALENVRTAARGNEASLLSSVALSALMGKALPNLRHLELVYANMYYCVVKPTALRDHAAFSAPGLVTLRLYRQRISADTLYHILRDTPLLETLEVQWAYEDASPMLANFPRNPELLFLPHLSDVSLGSGDVHLQDLCPFWKLIRPHPDVGLSLWGFPSTPLRELFSGLAPQLQRASGNTLTIRGSTAAPGFSLCSSSESSARLRKQPCVDVKFACHAFPVFFAHLIEDIFGVAHHEHIHILNLDSGKLIAPETVVQLARLTELKELCVDFDTKGPLAVLNSLSLPDPAPPLFPGLETLVLKRINLSKFTTWKAEGRAMARAFLQRRKEAGVPVSKLVLRGARSAIGSESFDDDEGEVLRELSEHVGEVVDERCDHVGRIM